MSLFIKPCSHMWHTHVNGDFGGSENRKPRTIGGRNRTGSTHSGTMEQVLKCVTHRYKRTQLRMVNTTSTSNKLHNSMAINDVKEPTIIDTLPLCCKLQTKEAKVGLSEARKA